MGIIDHIGLQVSDYDRALAFYMAALKPLGIQILVQFPPEGPAGGAVAGFGKNGRPELWIGNGEKAAPPLQIALLADDRAAVDAFYDAAMEAGGVDNGEPGIRAEYHPEY